MKHYLQKINKLQIIKQYVHAHVFLYAGIQIILNGFSKKGLEISNLSIENKILEKLRKKYSKTIYKYKIAPIRNNATKSGIIWMCWLQGIESAPLVVKKCYQSIVKNLNNKEIVLLTEENYHKYVTFPEYIERKIKEGIITKTHLSDLLRIELLTTYGGTWIDATVFCSTPMIPDCFLESDFFLFQSLKPALSGHPTRISSWFITANTNSNILNLTKLLLYDYWKKNKTMASYFLLHNFMELAIEAFPNEWNNVLECCNSTAHIMQYSSNLSNMKELLLKYNNIPFHKLTYKNEEKESFYLTLIDFIGGL